MPPRRRRAGYRPGQLSPEQHAAITAPAAQVEAAGEPLAVIDAVVEVFASLEDTLAEVALPRLRAIAQLRAGGWSYDRISAATQLSKGRVAQLAREARARGL